MLYRHSATAYGRLYGNRHTVTAILHDAEQTCSVTADILECAYGYVQQTYLVTTIV